ncbi:MAG: hypothetical protein ACLTBV_27355 [Enterocloster bolteae]
MVEFTDENFFNGDFTKDKFIGSFLESGNADGVQYMIPLLGEVLGCVVKYTDDAGGRLRGRGPDSPALPRQTGMRCMNMQRT